MFKPADFRGEEKTIAINRPVRRDRSCLGNHPAKISSGVRSVYREVKLQFGIRAAIMDE
jgi:hypothetical protein